MSRTGKIQFGVLVVVILAALTYLFRAEISSLGTAAEKLSLPSWSVFWQYAAVSFAAVAVLVVFALMAFGRSDEPYPTLSRVPVLCLVGVMVSVAMATVSHLAKQPHFVQLTAAFLALFTLATQITVIPQYSAGIVALGSHPVRSVGSGWCLHFWPLETVVEVHPVKDTSINDVKIQVELGGTTTPGAEKEYLNLEMTLKYRQDVKNMIAYARWEKDKLEKTLQDDLEKFATDEFKKVTDIQEAYNQLEELEKKMTQDLQAIQREYGIVVYKVKIDDAAEDPELLKRKVERENQKRDAALQVEIQKDINKKRTLEMNKVRQEAVKIIKEAEKEHREAPTMKEAILAVQTQFGIVKTEVKEDKKVIEFGPGTRKAAEVILPAIFGRGDNLGGASGKDPIGF